MMNQDFDAAAYEAFEQAALDKYDFTTCQRADGSYYGTGGTCRKGSEVKGGVPKKEKKMASMRAKDLKARGASGENHGKTVKASGGGSNSGEYRTRPKGAIESDMKKLTSSGAMNQKGTAGVKAREEHAKLKAELNKPLKGANSKSGTGTKQQPKKDPFAKHNAMAKKIEADLRKKYANKKPDGGLTEKQVRAGGGRLD